MYRVPWYTSYVRDSTALLWFSVGVAVLLISPLVKKLMHLDKLKDEELAGRAELAEPQAAGLDLAKETR